MNEGMKRRARHAAAAAVACLLSLAHAGLHAQETADAASAAQEAALPADLAKVAREPLAQQARWLRTAAQRGTLAQLDDATLTALFKALDPLAVPLYIRNGPNGYPSYQFTYGAPGAHQRKVVRHARPHAGEDHPRAAARLCEMAAGRAHAGQETIYDTTQRKDEMYGHLGGLLGKIPLWTSLDGALARAQSNHQVKDLGTEFITNLYLTEGKKYLEAGVQRPTQIEAKSIGGVRVVALTYETPTGRPQFYAKKEVLGLDLHAPYFRTVESYDNDGRIFERIVIEKIAPATLDDTAFDPKNPDYAF